MRKNKKELIKINNLLLNDRGMEDYSLDDLLLHDLNRLLEEYYEIKEKPLVSISDCKCGYKINISFIANTQKRYKTLH